MSSKTIENIFTEEAIGNIANLLVHLNKVHVRLSNNNKINPAPIDKQVPIGNFSKPCYYPNKYDSNNRPR